MAGADGAVCQGEASIDDDRLYLSMDLVLGAKPLDLTTGTPEEQRLRAAIQRVESASRKALSEYVPSVYEGDAVLFRAQEQEIQSDYDPVLWWHEVLRGRVDVIDVPGDHHAIIREPGVYDLARKLRECLDRVRVAR